MTPIRVALLGAGAMGSNHARVISSSPHAELSVIIDPYEPFGRALADKHGTNWSADPAAIGQVDAIVVATATESHFDAALEPIRGGMHALIEKPLAASLAESEQLVAASRESGSVLMCGLLERFNPAVLTARSFIRDPRHVVATRHSPFTPRIKTHVAWDLMVHDVDLALQIFGAEPERAHAVCANAHSPNGVADIADAVLRFPGERVAAISASRASQRKVRQLTVSEPERLVEIDLLRRNVTVFHNVQESDVDEGRGYKQEAVIEIPELVSSLEPLTAQFEHFVSLIRDAGDRDVERDSLLPAHRALERLLDA